MLNKVNFVGFRGGDHPAPDWNSEAGELWLCSKMFEEIS